MRIHVSTLRNFTTFMRAEAPALGVTLEEWTSRMELFGKKKRNVQLLSESHVDTYRQYVLFMMLNLAGTGYFASFHGAGGGGGTTPLPFRP